MSAAGTRLRVVSHCRAADHGTLEAARGQGCVCPAAMAALSGYWRAQTAAAPPRPAKAKPVAWEPIRVTAPSRYGERKWRCPHPHGATGRKAGSCSFAGRVGLLGTLQRHLAKYHPDRVLSRDVIWEEDE